MELGRLHGQQLLAAWPESLNEHLKVVLRELALIAAERGLTTPADTAGAEDDATQALADAQQQLADEIEALRKEIAQQNAIAKSELAIGLYEAKRAFADMLSGELGGKVTSRSHTAGAGSVVRT